MSRREAEDASGPALAAAAEDAGCDVAAMEVVPDDYALIEDRLNHFIDAGFEVILTTGGTGLTQDDVTPDATRSVIDREIPGIAEALAWAESQVAGEPDSADALTRLGAELEQEQLAQASAGMSSMPAALLAPALLCLLPSAALLFLAAG